MIKCLSCCRVYHKALNVRFNLQHIRQITWYTSFICSHPLMFGFHSSPSPSLICYCFIGQSVFCRLLIVVWSRTICIDQLLTPCWDTLSSKIWLMRDKFASCSKITWIEPERRERKVRRNGCLRQQVHSTDECTEDRMGSAFASCCFSFIKTKSWTGAKLFLTTAKLTQWNQF